MPQPDPRNEVLDELFARRIDAEEAARRLQDLGVGWVMYETERLTAEQQQCLKELERARGELYWEAMKKRNPRLPELKYDSPQYHAWLATFPSSGEELDAPPSGTA
jgi:hypothetical protein